MRNVLNFIIKYQAWFVFLFYVVLSGLLLFNFNDFQQSVYLSSANRVSSSLYGLSSEMTGYVGLREVNADLEKENASLQAEILRLREEVKYFKMRANDSVYPYLGNDRYSFLIASVLHSDIRHDQNYFTIDKGAADGVAPGMGVINRCGLVGIVNVTGQHTSRVISLLNEKQIFSVRLKGTENTGQLVWKRGNPRVAYMDELARHARYRIGDTLVTSGFSTSFPEGVPVGTVMSRVRSDNENYLMLKIRLLPDFTKLESVRVIRDFLKEEIDSLQGVENIRTDESIN